MRNSKSILFLIVLVLIAIVAYYIYSNNIIKNLNQIDGAKAKTEYLKDIQKVMLIPSEDPTYLVIDNADLLSKQQSFFQNAINGDALFVFQNTGRAIIWSPSRSLIVNSGPIEYSSSTTNTKDQKVVN
jgi:hypothetical protein